MKRQPYLSIVITIIWIVTFILLAMEGLRHAGAQDAYTLPPIVQQRVSADFTRLTGQPVPYLGMRSVSTSATACLPVGSYGQTSPVRGYFVMVKYSGVEFRYYATPAGAVTLCNVAFPVVKR